MGIGRAVVQSRLGSAYGAHPALPESGHGPLLQWHVSFDDVDGRFESMIFRDLTWVRVAPCTISVSIIES
jgi:hypothetical protein